ncbi:MAG: nitroreductase family protein [Kiritimatiellae bacterium]|nr:nitroreductase family protein [Kiritimatiellia bacterium]
MNMKELVKRARSTRRFDQSRPIGKDVLLALVDMARLSPCGGNTQPLRYRIVHDPDECRAIFPFIAWAAALKPWPGPAEGERPTGYILILGQDQTADVTTGIAAQTMHLAAAEMGYGCCMLGAIQRDKIKQTLKIPDPYQVKLALAFGVPAEKIVIEEVAAGTDLRYYRTPDDVHHVPKLRLEDVLV